ncbi:hypothetical protein V8E54_014102 [Elaphomyces granulatus]
MVPAGKKLGTENFEQLLKIARRYKLGSQAEKMLADRGRDLRKRVKPILQSITRVRREAFKFHEEAERDFTKEFPIMIVNKPKLPVASHASMEEEDTSVAAGFVAGSVAPKRREKGSGGKGSEGKGSGGKGSGGEGRGEEAPKIQHVSLPFFDAPSFVNGSFVVQ